MEPYPQTLRKPCPRGADPVAYPQLQAPVGPQPPVQGRAFLLALDGSVDSERAVIEVGYWARASHGDRVTVVRVVPGAQRPDSMAPSSDRFTTRYSGMPAASGAMAWNSGAVGMRADCTIE